MTFGQSFLDAVQLHRAGRLAEAERLYRHILSQNPGHHETLHMLGVLAHQAGQNAAAEELIRQAIAIQPGIARYHGNLGTVLSAQARQEEAISAFGQAVALQPRYAEGFNNLASLLVEAGKLEQARDAALKALEIKPGFAEAHYNLGAVARTRGEWPEAERSFQAAADAKPDYAEAYNALGDALAKQGKTVLAIEAFKRAVTIRPAFPEAYNNLGNTLRETHRFREAYEAYRSALSYRPSDPVVLNNLSTVLEGVPEAAEQCVEVYQREIAANRNLATSHYNLGNVLRTLGRLDEAAAHFRRSLELKPHRLAAANLLYMIHFHPDYGPEKIAAEHRRWNEQLVKPLACLRRPHTNIADPERPLRIGYVSPDFREHPVGRFLLPILRNHNHTNYKIHCYSDVKRPSPLTEEFRRLADVWRETISLDDEALSQLIRDDQIDVLVDLAMHTQDNRMYVFARKPAPVQASYLAYNSTTGNEAIDYRLTDPYFDPLEDGDGPYVERPVRLRTYWCYSDPPLAPRPKSSPDLTRDHVTFGCLNSFGKVSELTCRTWSRLLRSTPDSRLILRAGAHVLARFAAEGIDPGRVELYEYLPFNDYFETYNRIDVALDPFPYPGGTTTFDALWMGVPVVTLAGRTTVSRGGVSILSHLGYRHWIAQNEGQYIQIAIDLAHAIQERTRLRTALRNELRSSILMNAPECTRDVEAAYRQMWNTWCVQHKATLLP